MLKRFLKDQSGATAIEYGLICALIFLTILGALSALTDGTNSLFGRVGTNVNGALH